MNNENSWPARDCHYFIVRKQMYSLSFSILGMTLLPFFIYDARKPSTEKMIKGGRTKLKAKAAGL